MLITLRFAVNLEVATVYMNQKYIIIHKFSLRYNYTIRNHVKLSSLFNLS